MAHKPHVHSSIDKHFKQLNAQILLWQTRSIPSSGSLLQQLHYFCNICWSGCMLVCSMLRVDLRYCVRVHALSIQSCTCTPSHSMHGRRSPEFNILACCRTAHLLQRWMQELGTTQSCTCTMYTSHYKLAVRT